MLKKVSSAVGEDVGALGEDGVLLSDDFAKPIRPGRVVGARTPSGDTRKGVDRESIISADNGALRIAPPLAPGWGREGIAYGPFSRQNGLTLAVFMINGHNTSQSANLTETFRARLNRWFVGPEVFRRRHRLIQFLKSTRKLRTIRQWRWWRRIAKDAPPVQRVDENLAVGWFPAEVPHDPLTTGSAFVMHATGAENGELWTRAGDAMLPAVRGVQNLQIYYVVVLRECGAAYYSSSVPNANGLGSYPGLRPIAIDPFGTNRVAYAGLHQSTLGQIGFRLDTRVYGVRVARVGEWGAWFGSAIAADKLHGSSSLDGSAAEAGGDWQVESGSFERTHLGARPTSEDCVALLLAAAPVGLVHMLVSCGSNPPAITLLWRYQDAANHWRVTFDAQGVVLSRVSAGTSTVLARTDAVHLRVDTQHSVQLLDDGSKVGVHLDGGLVFGERFEDVTLAEARQVGFAASGIPRDVAFEKFEVHARSCTLPSPLSMGIPWYRLGERLVVTEGFEGPERDLHGKSSSCGNAKWSRSIGVGQFRVTGASSARIEASSRQPNPGRTAYTVEWAYHEFADLEVEITPAGTAKGQREHGLCGFIFWQDPDNYVTLNIWRYDTYDGASISTFFQLDGFEDLYDAIWANVGDRVYWGKPFRLRVVFDGMHFMAFVDDVPVLYRALTDVYPDAKRLQIRRVGLLANWEWGNDTGSSFASFKARA